MKFMNIETLREYCILKKNVTESFPFGDDTLVFKTAGRIFALVNLDGDLSINLKCDPSLAIELREIYSSVVPTLPTRKNYKLIQLSFVEILLDNIFGRLEYFIYLCSHIT